uniref:Activin_recp domain-containing protein n=1 Tax=Globodera pallida TaxID=36090 RepID=A0A183BSD5_GLOPA
MIPPLYPPISHVVATMGSPQFMEIMNECLEDQNPLALYSVGQALRNHGLGFIGAAFKQAITERMICRDCIELIVLDDLCYCQDSKTKCHHGTTCCEKRKILDDICYCDDAKTKCHCNSRTCCTVTVEERGKST